MLKTKKLSSFARRMFCVHQRLQAVGCPLIVLFHRRPSDDCTWCVRVRACVHVCVLLGEYIFMKTCLVHVANGSSTGQVQKTSFYLKVVTNNQQ